MEFKIRLNGTLISSDKRPVNIIVSKNEITLEFNDNDGGAEHMESI